MNTARLEDLSAAGAVVPLPSGQRGIKVLLTWEACVNAPSFRETCQLLRNVFAALASRHAGVALDMDTLAPASHSVKGTILAERFEELVASLGSERCHVRIRVARDAATAGRSPARARADLSR